MAKRSPPKLARTGAGNARASKAVAHPCWPGWLERDAVKALLLIIPVILAYHPAWHAGFIWEDDDYVTKDALLTAPDGLWRIWFSYDSPSQYFPLVYSTFRLEHALWGLEPSGYHWVNILFQCADAVLLWQVLRRLEIPGAWLAAAIFAVHPVQVESVAWVTELKNVEMGFFYLLTLLAWMRFTGEGKGRAWGYYGLSLLFYALALCAKTTACTLPVVFLLIDWLRGGRIRWRALIEAAPFFGLGIGMGLLSVLWERYHQGTEGPMFSIGLPERLLVAGRGVWFYLWKLVWPAKLTCSYPRWNLSPADPLAYLWLLGVCGLFALAWWARRFFGRAPLVALSFFVITLGPVLGFIMLYTFRYSFVADHYQYLACIGPIALVACGITLAMRRMDPEWGEPLEKAIGGLLVAGLGALTWSQSGMYTNLETLWLTTLERNPDAWMARNNLGAMHLDAGRTDDAMAEFLEALRINPDDAETHNNLANALIKIGKPVDAIAEYDKALQIDREYPDARANLGNALVGVGKTKEAEAQFREALRLNPGDLYAYNDFGTLLVSQGRFDEAAAQFRMAIQKDPSNATAHNNLAGALNCQGLTAQAIAEYEEALRINPNYPDAHYNLGAVLMQQGRYGDATKEFESDVKLNPMDADAYANLGLAFYDEGRIEDAIAAYGEALRINPKCLEAHKDLGMALFQQGRAVEAIAESNEALKEKPGDFQIMGNLAWMLAAAPDLAARDGTRAEQLAAQMNASARGSSPYALRTLAAAYAQEGNFDEAVQTAKNALRLAQAQSNGRLSDALSREVELYKARHSFEVGH